MSKPLISLCMIVKNEADVIARCLESVRDAVDEQIIVDTGSTDGTADIARQAGATVFEREWPHDFAAARNISLDLAKGDWLLVLDADETLETGYGPVIRQLIASHPQADGFFVQIVNYIGIDTKQAGSSQSSSLRLFRNRPGFRYEGRIHEQIVQPILTAKPGAQLLYSEIQLNHGGYLPEVVQRKNKVQRNMDLLQQELAHTNNESFHRYNLGVEYMRTGDYAKALEQFRLSRTVADWRQASFGHVVILREMNCLQVLGHVQEALELGTMATGGLSDFPDLFLTIGRIHYQLKQWQEAEAAFLQALKIGVASPKYTSVSGAGTFSASFHLGKTKEQLHDYEGAIQWYAHTLKLNSALLPPFLRLIGLLARSGPAEQITARLEQLFVLESVNTWWSIAYSYYQLGLYHQAADVLVTKPLPAQRQQDRRLLLLRCRLLAPGCLEDQQPVVSPGDEEEKELSLRASFYEAIAANNDQGALQWLNELEQRASNPGNPETPLSLLVSLFSNLVHGKQQLELPLPLPAEGSTVLWNELHFFYMLAIRKHLFALQDQVQGYWRQLLNSLPEPLQRLKGRYELIKTVHVRVTQVFRNQGGHPEYDALWDGVLPQLLTLIDDLLMEEVQ